MSEAAAKVLAEALRLSEEEREEIATQLMGSLQPDIGGPSGPEWEEELRRRIEEVDSGKVKTIPWEEAMRQILDGTHEPDEA